MSRLKRIALPILLAGVAALGLVACSKNGVIDTSAPRTFVSVSLREFTVTPAAATAPTGTIVFRVTNDGTEEHEFLVINTNLAPDALPTNPDGSYLENGFGTFLVDEIEGIQPHHSADLTISLAPGNYVLICNRVEGNESHYAMGMRAAFTVLP